MNYIIDEKPTNSINSFITQCKLLGFDYQKIYSTATACIKYYRGDKRARAALRDGQEIENRWYASIRAGKPDYRVYDLDYYVGDLWACWVVYSREYIRQLPNKSILPNMRSIYDDLGTINTIVDLGCGIAYTTAALKQLWPAATVYGTNLSGNNQHKFCQMMAKHHGLNIISDISDVNDSVDFVFASEYFEHFEKPVEHLEHILSKKPKALIIANAFGAISIGHFDHYKIGHSLYDGKATSKIFNDFLVKNGYEKVKTKLWNNRPSYWRLKNRQQHTGKEPVLIG